MDVERSASSASALLSGAAGVSTRSKNSLKEGHDALLRARVSRSNVPPPTSTPTPQPASVAEKLFQAAFTKEVHGLPDDDAGEEDTTSLLQDLFKGIKERVTQAGSKLHVPLQALPLGDLDLGIQDEVPTDMDNPEAHEAAADFQSVDSEAGGAAAPAAASAGPPAAGEKLTKRQMMSRMQEQSKKGGTLEAPKESKDGKPAEEDPLCKQLKEQIAENKPPEMKEAFGAFMDDNTVAGAIASMKQESSEGVRSLQEAAVTQLDAAREEFSNYFGSVFGRGSGSGSDSKGPGAGPAEGPQAQVPPYMRRIKKVPAKKKGAAEMGIFSWLDEGLSPGQLRLRRRVRTFALNHVLPNIGRWEETGTVPRTLMRQAGKEGLCAMYCSKLAGGEGMTFRDVAVAYEALGPAGLQAASFLAHQNMVADMMDQGAPLILRMTLTRALASGLALGTFASCEPLATLDNPDLTLSFGLLYKDQTGDYFILNGLKTEVPLAGSADIYLLALRTHEGINFFVLPKLYPGMFWLPKEDANPGSFVPVRKIVMALCIVRSETQMKTKAVKLVNKCVDGYRLSLAAAAVGAAQVAVDYAAEYLATRPMPVLSHQSLQQEIAGLHASAASARMLVRRAANSMDSKDKSCSSDCAMAKLCAVRIAMDVASQSMNLLGGAAMTEVGAVLLKLQHDLAAYTLLGGDDELLTGVVYKGLTQKAQKEKKKGGEGGSGGDSGDEDSDPVDKLKNMFGAMLE